ncbi:MAG: ThiF family adenylyltransferase [Promethearchaeota archaeon]
MLDAVSHYKNMDLKFQIKALEFLMTIRYHKQPKLQEIKKKLLTQLLKYNSSVDQKLRSKINENLDQQERERWDRQLNHPLINQKKIKNARIVVFGLGGIGSNVLLSLSYSWIHDFKIIDFDTIDLSNLNRQTLYFEEDLRKLKSEKAVERLLMINPKINVKAYNLKIDYPEDLNVFELEEEIYSNTISLVNDIIKWGDYIVIAMDLNGAPYLINDLCIKNQKSFYWAGVNHSFGEIYSYNPNKVSACLRCIFGPYTFLEKTPFLRYKNKKNYPFNGANIGSTVIITGSLVSEFILQDICAFPTHTYGQYIIFNALNHEIINIPIKNHDKCYCSKF